MTRCKSMLIIMAIVLLAPTLMAVYAAEENAPSSFSDSLELSAGADVRIREVYFDDIPIIADPPGITRGGDNHFFRFRTRAWAQADLWDNVSVKVRAVNEFRDFDKPDNGSWNAMDEFVIDNAYIEIRDIFDTVSLRLGRQDMIYGTGKLILDGTPKDGSRTIYMDAAKLTWAPEEGTTVDLLGIYNQPENELVIHGEDRDVTGFDPAFNDLTESGGGIYLKNNSWISSVPLEAYYLYKKESDWTTRSGAVVGERNIHTVGGMVKPKLAESIDGRVELAVQRGDIEDGAEDQSGFMVDALVNWHITDNDMKPCLGLGLYYLSGDDPNTAKDEGWNPLWARWPQYSELYVYSWDAEGAGRWSNINMPHIDFTMAPASWVKSKAMLAYLMAPESDGPGGGDERGLLFTLRNDLDMKCLTPGLKGHLLLELLEPGNYYNVDNTAYFARWEMTYAF